MVSGCSGTRGRDDQFDISPLDDHTINNIDQKKLITMTTDEEEKEYDHHIDDEALLSMFQTPPLKPTAKLKTPYQGFLSMPSEDITVWKHLIQVPAPSSIFTLPVQIFDAH
jgi:hypothetical protein